MKKVSGVRKRHLLKNFFKGMSSPYDLRIRNAIDGEELLHLTLTKRSVYLLISSLLVLSFLLVSLLFLFTPIKYYIPGYETKNSRKKVIQLQQSINALELKQKNTQKRFDLALSALDTNRQGLDTTQLSENELLSAGMSNKETLETKNKRARRNIPIIDSTQN